MLEGPRWPQGNPQSGEWLALALEPWFAGTGLELAVPWALVVAEVEEEERSPPRAPWRLALAP